MEIGVELISVIFNVLYIVGIARQKIWAWPSGFIGCALAVWMFYSGGLYAESLLNIIYSVLAIYGWRQWSLVDVPKSIRLVKKPEVYLIILIVLILGLLAGYAMAVSTKTPLPYIDCMIASVSILATIWQAKRVLENWLLWIILNIATIFIYLNRDYDIYAIYSFFLVIMSFWGLRKWRHILSQPHS